MNLLFSALLLTTALCSAVFGQVSLPRESQRQELHQVVGDTKISVVYHRPNVKGRKIWGELVPYGEVWRSGANENTTIEFSRDVTIGGQPLTAGKYGFHTIPGEKQWTLIFNKVNDAWGSFTYKQENDALRITVKPEVTPDRQETLVYTFGNLSDDSAELSLVWDRLRVPFKIGIGDVQTRILTQIDEAIKARKADDVRPLNQGASYVFTFKIRNRYEQALGWLDTSLTVRKAFGTLVTKARLLEQMGRKDEAISVGETAIAFGKASNPPAPTADIERFVTQWKAVK